MDRLFELEPLLQLYHSWRSRCFFPVFSQKITVAQHGSTLRALFHCQQFHRLRPDLVMLRQMAAGQRPAENIAERIQHAQIQVRHGQQWQGLTTMTSTCSHVAAAGGAGVTPHCCDVLLPFDHFPNSIFLLLASPGACYAMQCQPAIFVRCQLFQ